MDQLWVAYGQASLPLNNVLAKLAHMDLTDRVRRDAPDMKANGGFCDVFTGFAILPGRPSESTTVKVAIKRLRVHLQSDISFAKLLAKELHLWSKLDHPNILPLLGFMFEGEYPSVVSEWMENGTVSRYIKTNPGADIELLILGLAEGVAYLHNLDVIHSDLKAENVLVGNSGEPLICDFGIARMINSSLTMAGTSTGTLNGSARWMAYELFDIHDKDTEVRHTKETDVWAFGMTIYEILTGHVPYPRLKNDAQVIFAITNGELPPRICVSNDAAQFLQSACDLCEKCWISPPSERLTMKEIVRLLRSVETMTRTEPEPTCLYFTFQSSVIELPGHLVDLSQIPTRSSISDVTTPDSENYLQESDFAISDNEVLPGQYLQANRNAMKSSITINAATPPSPANVRNGGYNSGQSRPRGTFSGRFQDIWITGLRVIRRTLFSLAGNRRSREGRHTMSIGEPNCFLSREQVRSAFKHHQWMSEGGESLRSQTGSTPIERKREYRKFQVINFSDERQDLESDITSTNLATVDDF